jgi:hypothetical protein
LKHQKLAWDNRIDKGFNTTNVPLEFGLLTAEAGEAFTAWRKGLSDFGEELADVFLYPRAVPSSLAGARRQLRHLAALSERPHTPKIAKNRDRVYCRNEHGVLIRVADTDED